MPISELRCPRCGVDVKVGLPRGATVKSVSPAALSAPDEERVKVRSLGCENGHEFSVLFEW